MTRAETETIKCEACKGYGVFYDGPKGRGFETINGAEMVKCDLCNGTGREPADVKARRAIEGSKADG